MKKHTIEQDKLREILARYGEEFGDAIVDEICKLFKQPTTPEE
jgi:Ca2+-binding EF-hand superfamily protein